MSALIAWLAQVLALCRKEFLAVVKDPANRSILIAPALMQALLFGYGATYDLRHVPYVVVDQSRGEVSAELLSRLDGTGVFKREATLTSPDQIAGVIDSGKALLAIVIPSDFEQRLNRGDVAPVQVILDGRNSSTAGSAAAYIGAIVTDLNVARGAEPPVRVERRAWYNPNLESRWTLMPALIAALEAGEDLPTMTEEADAPQISEPEPEEPAQGEPESTPTPANE